MSKINFSIQINAPKEKVWEKLWSDEGYRRWTAAFTEGSYAESEWKEGSRIKFLSPGGNGMFGIIKQKIDFERMTFQHLGEIKDGKEEPKEWAGAIEDYQLKDKNGGTELLVELEMNEAFHDYFNSTFPKALQILKDLSEN
jgi:hypothetical protein